MQNWHDNVLRLISEIDRCIRAREGETLTLAHLARLLGCSQSQVSHKFHALTGTSLRDFVQARRPALALPAVRDGEQRLLDIALDCGFSSQEAFTRAFRAAYGITPGEYRRSPRPLSLRTVIRPLDCYLAEQAPAGTENDVQTYFITLPAHKFAHIRNYESIGYWDFMQKQSRIPGADLETVSALLRQLAPEAEQQMAFVNEPSGRICSWGIPLAECWGVRLPHDCTDAVPAPLQLMEVPEGDYLVFEHGPFDLQTENNFVEAKIERAMRDFDYEAAGCCLDTAPGRVFYFVHDCVRFWKYIRPVVRF